MAEFAELCLWAALPLSVLSAALSFAGAAGGRRDLADAGGRAAEATAALILLSLAGLGEALVTVRLKYAYVAALSGFQEPTLWRVAALWSGPAGGLLTLTFVIAVSAAVSHRSGRAPYAVARTGALATLTFVGLLTAVARADPFAQPAVTATLGSGLPLAMKQATWQIELWAAYLAAACAAFAFAGVLGQQFTEWSGEVRTERRVMALAAGLLTLALLALSWRAYADTGRLLNVTGLSRVASRVPAWLLAFAYLHAPGGSAVPAWAARWRRVVSVALFPAALGALAAQLVGVGGPEPISLWAGGLAVGVVSGAMSGLSGATGAAPGLRDVPGYGPWALQGGLMALGLAGLVAVWGALRGPLWAEIAWPIALLALAMAAAWSVSRPAARWRRVWPTAVAAAVAGTLAMYRLGGDRAPESALAVGLALAVLVGGLADAVRLRSVRRVAADPRALSGALDTETLQALKRERAARRWTSVAGHVALALLLVGLSAQGLSRMESRTLEPGGTLEAAGGREAGVRLTYLGLSRYQIDRFDKRVASFTLRRGSKAELVTAETVVDMATNRVSRTPALARGILGDVVVEMAGRTGSTEGIVARLGVRPLASLVWLGGLLLLATAVARAGSAR